MINMIRICGPAGWGLLVASLAVAVTFAHAAISCIRGETEQRVRLRYRLNALIFWGFMGAVLGFIGQTSAIHNAMTAIIPAKSISPETIDRGFRESFVPSFWGFGIFIVSAFLYAGFRFFLGFGSRKPRRGSPSVRSASGLAVGMLLFPCVFPGPAAAPAAGGVEVPEVLTDRVWVGKGGGDDIVFRVWHAGDGVLMGEAHTLRGGKHRTQSPAVNVTWNNPELELEMNTGVVFRGTMDAGNDHIDGALFHRGRQIMELPLNGVDPGRVGGLLARPAPSPGEKVYTYSVPASTGDGWQSAGPEAVGLERRDLEALVTGVIEGRAGLLHSLLIARGNELVLEEYFHGYGRDDLHRLASVTKSVSSLITGIAIDRGDISGVDAGLGEFFPRQQKNLSDTWNEVTLEHLLTMSIGTAWTAAEADNTHGTGDKFFKELLSRDFAFSPGEKWQYVSANVNLLGGVIRAATGKHADEYAAEYLFEPLGIEEWNWDYGKVDGYRLMDGSLMLTPRSMARLGALVANRGEWNGKRVVSADWIDRSTSPHMVPSEGAPEKYGYLWWLFYIPSGDGEYEAIVANGAGSQIIAVFPALDLVVVTTGSNDENGKQFAIGKLLSAHVLDRM